MAKKPPVVESGILLTCSKKPVVNISVPGNMKRRITDLITRANLGSGEYLVVLEAYYPNVLENHPWVKITQEPGSTMSYRLVVRIKQEAFDCKLRIPMRYANPEAVLKLNKAAAYFSEHGWFEEKVAQTAHPLAVAWAAAPKTEEVPAVRSQEPNPEPEHTKCDTNTKEDWKTAAELLISQNSQRLAMIETELEKKIAVVTAKAREEIKSLRQAYKAATEGLRDENRSLKETLEQLFPTREGASE